MKNLTAEQRVQKAHIYLMGNPKYCLYSGIFMLGRTEVRDDLPTAYTDGINKLYGRAFVETLTDQELRGLILHEANHVAFRHLTMWRSLFEEDADTAGRACDYVINLMIHDSDPDGTHVKLPEGGCFDVRFRGMDAQTVYRLLRQEKQSSNKPQPGQGQGQPKPGQGQAQPGQGEGFDEHDWKAARGMKPEEEAAIQRDVDQALRQGRLLAGKLSGNVPREVVEALTPKVDWRAALREFITSTCADRDEATWQRPNRRWIGQDVYMPSLAGESLGRVVVAVDTSGSITGPLLGQFLGELRAICETVQPEAIELLYWDTRVCGHETYERGSFERILTSTKPAGGGGTYAGCIPAYIKQKRVRAECCVVLTDGFVGGWGDEWPCPMLWAITSDVVAPVGTTVKIN